MTRAQSVPNTSSPAMRVDCQSEKQNRLRKPKINSVADLINLDTRQSCAPRNRVGTATRVETPLDQNYMAVIKESNFSVMSRHELLAERRKILDLDVERDSKQWNKIRNEMRK